MRWCVLPAAAETAHDKGFSGPLTCHAVVAVKTWKNLPIIDNALHVGGVDVDPGYLQTMVSLINHTAYKSFLDDRPCSYSPERHTCTEQAVWYSDTLPSLWTLSFNESSGVFVYFSTSAAQGHLSMCQDCGRAQPVEGQSL